MKQELADEEARRKREDEMADMKKAKSDLIKRRQEQQRRAEEELREAEEEMNRQLREKENELRRFGLESKLRAEQARQEII